MIAWLENPLMSRSVVSLRAYQFPGLPTEQGWKFGTWRWNRMTDLDKAVTQTLRLEGYKGPKISLIPDYSTFSIENTPDHFPLPFQMPFAWVVELYPKGKVPYTRFCMDFPRQCDFSAPNLFIPQVWGHQVLRFAKEGLISIKLEGKNPPIGYRWNGDLITADTMNQILED